MNLAKNIIRSEKGKEMVRLYFEEQGKIFLAEENYRNYEWWNY